VLHAFNIHFKKLKKID